MNCSACGRIVTRPQYAGGEPFGSTCFSRLAPLARATAHAKAGGRRRRAVAKPRTEELQRDLFEEPAHA